MRLHDGSYSRQTRSFSFELGHGVVVEVITETVRQKYHAAQVLAGPVCAKHILIQLQIAVWHEEYGWIMLRMLHVLFIVNALHVKEPEKLLVWSSKDRIVQRNICGAYLCERAQSTEECELRSSIPGRRWASESEAQHPPGFDAPHCEP